MRQLFSRFSDDQSGATAIEYCLIACGIAFAIIASVQASGPAQHQIHLDQYFAEITLRILARWQAHALRLLPSAFNARSIAMRANISQPPPVSAAWIKFSTAICQRCCCWACPAAS